MKSHTVRAELSRQGWRFTPMTGDVSYNPAFVEALARGESVHVVFAQGPHTRDLHVPCRTPHLPGQLVTCKHGTWGKGGYKNMPDPGELRTLFKHVDDCPLGLSAIEFHPLSTSLPYRALDPLLDSIIGEYLSNEPADCECDPELHIWTEVGPDRRNTWVNTGHEDWCPQFGTRSNTGVFGFVNRRTFTPTGRP